MKTETLKKQTLKYKTILFVGGVLDGIKLTTNEKMDGDLCLNELNENTILYQTFNLYTGLKIFYSIDLGIDKCLMSLINQYKRPNSSK